MSSGATDSDLHSSEPWCDVRQLRSDNALLFADRTRRAAYAEGLAETAPAVCAAVFGVERHAMDPVRIAECWATSTHAAAGRTSSIERYDQSKRCVAVLTQTGPLCRHLHETWEAIAASLLAYEGWRQASTLISLMLVKFSP